MDQKPEQTKPLKSSLKRKSSRDFAAGKLNEGILEEPFDVEGSSNSVQEDKKAVKFDDKDLIDTNAFRENRNVMLRHRGHFRETSSKINNVYEGIKFLSDNAEETKRLFEQDKQIKTYLEREERRDLKNFVETIEETHSVLEGKITSIHTQAEETIKKFDDLKSATEQDEHLESFRRLRGDASNILSELEKTKKLVEQAKILRKRAKETLKSTEQQGSGGDTEQQEPPGEAESQI